MIPSKTAHARRTPRRPESELRKKADTRIRITDCVTAAIHGVHLQRPHTPQAVVVRKTPAIPTPMRADWSQPPMGSTKPAA